MSQYDDEENLNQGQVTVPLGNYQSMSNNLLFLQDRYTSTVISNDPVLGDSDIRGTHLNRTTNITRREAEVFQLLSARDYAIKEAQLDEEYYSATVMFKISSAIRNEQLAIHDSIDGWKTKQLLTKEKKISYTDQPDKKPGFFSRLN
jgi:hypothetical protein